MPLPTANGGRLPGAVPMQVDELNDREAGVAEAAPGAAHSVLNPTLDLDAYCSSYRGLARLHRLQFVAEHCSTLRLEALRMAIAYVMTTFNTGLYSALHQRLREAISSSASLPDAVASMSTSVLDSMWIETTSKKAAIKLEKLDTDLKNYKSNSIKESIRRGHDDLGDHYMDCGDLPNALKSYTRARDYCTSAKHVVHMCLNVIKVSVYLQNWSHVLNYVAKAENQADISEHFGKEAPSVQSYLNCAAGLAELHVDKYKNAARRFLQPSLDHTDFPELLSPSNIATYGVICALATFDRQELHKLVISSTSFKLFLELEPQIRDILWKFHDSRYAECLTLMEEVKDNLLLDMYLAPHVNKLYAQIRNRALCQYFSPYVSADMRKMAAAFNTSVASLEDELMNLILEGHVNARIDSHSKVLYAKLTDARSSTFERALRAGEEYQRRTRALLFRGACLRQQICVRNSGRAEGSEMSLSPGNTAGASRN